MLRILEEIETIKKLGRMEYHPDYNYLDTLLSMFEAETHYKLGRYDKALDTMKVS